MDEERNELTTPEEPKKTGWLPQSTITALFLRALVSGYVCYLGIDLLKPVFSGEETRPLLILGAAVLVLSGAGFAIYSLLKIFKSK